MTRPDNDTYFMKMAELVGTRSTCLRRQVGAVIVKEKRVLTTGYNGAPKGLSHCGELGCIRKQNQIESGTRHELCRGVHAEQNAVIQAAYFGVSIKDAAMYTTNFPCVLCSKIIVNAGIKEVVYKDEYVDGLSVDILNESKVVVRRYFD
ncbi:MAG: cytidine/deoxycytidylate deaminase family protein [Methanomassiliicoccales archaeon]|jgi:dCMP deaminase|nr:cytidine/deoxycytidylate deaminase family protein [Methanomassiliicoccales archaeon]